MSLSSEIIRHAREFKRALTNNRYEVDHKSQGIYLSEARVFVQGEYIMHTDGERHAVEKNLVPLQGIHHMLDVALNGESAMPAWYLAIYSGAYTPVETLTAATFPAAASEITSATNGYSEATRQLWTPAGPAAGGIITSVDGSTDNKATFTITATGASITIRGAALLSEQAKGSGGGVLMSVSRFSNDRIEYAGNKFYLGYRVRVRQPV